MVVNVPVVQRVSYDCNKRRSCFTELKWRCVGTSDIFRPHDGCALRKMWSIVTVDHDCGLCVEIAELIEMLFAVETHGGSRSN